MRRGVVVVFLEKGASKYEPLWALPTYLATINTSLVETFTFAITHPGSRGKLLSGCLIAKVSVSTSEPSRRSG